MTKEQKTIIIVDDNDANLTACKKILKPYYIVYPAPSATKMFDLLEHNIIPDLILLDVEMPDINGYEATRMLKNTESHKKIPIIFLTARNDAISEMEGLNLGALDYIHKPFVSALLLRRIEMHLSLIEYQKLLEERNKSIEELLAQRTKEESEGKSTEAETQNASNAIRTPLNEIVNLLNLAMGTDNSREIKDYLNKASSTSKNLLALVNDSLEK